MGVTMRSSGAQDHRAAPHIAPHFTSGNDEDSHTSAEVWDPVTASFGPAGSLAETRGAHTATPLPDGRVLVVGGWGGGGYLASAEVWEPGDG